MYEEHPEFISPDPGAVLWRYMDLIKFMSLLETSSLFFARSDKLGDPFEGSLTRMNEVLQPHMYPFANWEDASRVLSKLRQEKRLETFVNCWHESENESAAMWKIYSREYDGIAVKTTFEALTQSFTDDRTVYVGKINYIDYSSEPIPEGNLFSPFLHKREMFEHEKEVRAIVSSLSNDPDHISKGQAEGGLLAEVNLSPLIREIVVDSRANDWFYNLLKAIVARYGLDAEVTRTALDAEPFW